MPKVHSVCSHIKIDRRQHLTKVKRSREWTAWFTESIHVITSVIGDNNDETMNICQKFGKEKILNSIPVHHLPSVTFKVLSHKKIRKGCDKEMQNKVRKKDNCQELCQRVKVISSLKSYPDGDCPFWMNIRGNFLALASHFGKLEFFVSVGGIVVPLPRKHCTQDQHVFEHDGSIHFSDFYHVLFNKIGIGDLAKIVMMAVIVLNVPCFGHHPVKPIIETTP
mmetsp:Transcript_8245/g.12683  ORF Transcript_8245/g.12683 Transcript_8245/m.12683 type:complete len:222 (+) Transcript_8245:484-1149(+)